MTKVSNLMFLSIYQNKYLLFKYCIIPLHKGYGNLREPHFSTEIFWFLPMYMAQTREGRTRFAQEVTLLFSFPQFAGKEWQLLSPTGISDEGQLESPKGNNNSTASLGRDRR